MTVISGDFPQDSSSPCGEHSADIREDSAFRFRRTFQHFISKASWLIGRKFNQNNFEIVKLAIGIPNLASSFQGYRIVHISDIHYGQWITAERMAGIAGLINDQKPDLVAITGDFVSYSDKDINDMAPWLKAIQAKDGKVAVLGNHDHWLDAAIVRSILRESGVRELDNDVLTVTRAYDSLYFAGVGCTSLKKQRLDRVLLKLPSDGPAVLLAHEPNFADVSCRTKRFSLQLSGHSHGSQCIIPGIGSPAFFTKWRKYFAGKYQVGGMSLYTNRGLGTNNFWFRINCPPEITVIELQAIR